MKKVMLLPLSFAFALAIAGLSGSAFAADQTQDAYNAFNQKVAPIQQQLYAKQAELDAVYANPQPDTAKAQQLFREIGDLRGQLFAAEAELRSQVGDSGGQYAGMHHPGEFVQGGTGMHHPGEFADSGAYSGMHHPGEFSQNGYGYRGHRGGGNWGHRGGGYSGHGGGYHSGW